MLPRSSRAGSGKPKPQTAPRAPAIALRIFPTLLTTSSHHLESRHTLEYRNNTARHSTAEAGLFLSLALPPQLVLWKIRKSRQDGRRRSGLPPNGVALPQVCCDDWYASLPNPPISRYTLYNPPSPPIPRTSLANPIPVGRDKVLRTLQYFSRFLAWYLYRTNRPASSIAPFEATKKTFGQTRKLMRVGKFVEHFRAAAVASDAKGTDPLLRFTSVGRQLGYAVYMLCDNAAVVC
jgi:hypothetical protein